MIFLDFKYFVFFVEYLKYSKENIRRFMSSIGRTRGGNLRCIKVDCFGRLEGIM